MSSREVKRGTVLARVKAGDVPLGDAAQLLGVSYRQAKRLYARYRRGGARALVHGNVGRRSNHARAAEERARVLALIQAHYSGAAAPGAHQRFGPTLVAEHLGEEHGVSVPVTTLTRWMRAAELWSPVRQRRRGYQRRERRTHFGELLQLDGSFHDWLEGRDAGEPGRRCLMTLIDDATGTLLARFTGEETTWGAAGVLRAWVAQYGVPQALYVDAKSLYVPRPTTMEQQRGAVVYTQFGRMCATLGIALIVAKTPQAKGRVERIHGTNQDRLIKKLRRQGIATYAAANGYLTAHYLAEHNRRFALAPASPVDYHTRRARTVADQDVWCLETLRVVGNDWVVRYENRGYQLPARGPARRYCAPGSRVRVRETEDGAVRIVVRTGEGREHVLAWTPAALGPGRRSADPAARRVAVPTPARPTGVHPVLAAARAELSAIEHRRIAQFRGFRAYNERRRAAKLARVAARDPRASIDGSDGINP